MRALVLTIDLDGMAEYAGIHGVRHHPAPNPMYRAPLTRFARLCEKVGGRGTLFAITRDVEGEAAAALGRELSARHRTAIRAALQALAEAREGLEARLPLDLVAEILREATLELDGITGETTPEDLLDRIFAGFCLGK